MINATHVWKYMAMPCEAIGGDSSERRHGVCGSLIHPWFEQRSLLVEEEDLRAGSYCLGMNYRIHLISVCCSANMPRLQFWSIG